MTVPTSVAISSLPNTNLVSTNQLATSCVSLVSSTNGNQLSIPISIRTTLAANSPQTTMSWTQGNPIQFTAASQRPNGAISFVPQQAIYQMNQMPNDTILQPQTMLITQPSSRPPDQTTNAAQTAAGSIVQIMTPNGPAQLISTNLKQPTYTTNLITSNTAASNVTNTTTNSKSNNKQILPKGSKSKKNNNNSDKFAGTKNTPTINSKSSSSSNNKTLITTTSLSTTPTMNNFSNLNQPTLGAPQLMLNPQSGGFFTSNGLFFNQTLPTISTMGQQQFIINPTNQLGQTVATNTQTPNKTTPQTNQTILIPSSTANNQLKLQPTGLIQQPQNSAPQLIQLPNGQMLLVQPTQTSTEQQPTIIQNFNQPNTQTLQLIQQQPDGQTVSYSSGNNFIFTSQPSFVNSTISTNNTLLTTTTANTTSMVNTSTTTNNKSKSRRKQPAKKDNKTSIATTPNKVETTSNTATTPTTEQNKSKGLNLADLLKEAGIMDASPPSSPTNLNQTTTTTTTDLLDQSLNVSTNTTNSSTPQLTSLDLNDQQSTTTTTLLSNPTINNAALGQPTVVMMPPNTPNTPQGGAANYYFNPTSVNNTINQPQFNQPQFKLALAPDGTVILQQAVPTFAQPLNPTAAQSTQQTTVQSSNTTNFVDTSKVVDSCNSGSSQPSPDSTTPTLDSAITTTSCSSLSASTSTITFTTNSASTNSNSQLGSIKLTDSMSLTIQNNGQTIKDDNILKSQSTTSTTPANNKSKSRAKKTTTKKQQASKTTNINSTATSIQQQPTQQLITIPIQTSLNSSMNSVMPNTGTMILGDNNLIKKNDSGILVLNSTPNNATANQTTSVPMATHIDQNGVPVVQISLNNQEFLERLDTTVKSLSSTKNLTQEQETLLQELKSMQMKMLQAKTNTSESGDGNIILTTQPILSQPPQQTIPNLTANKSSSSLNSNTKLTKDIVNSTNSNIKTSNTQIITITTAGKPLDTTKKLGMPNDKQTTSVIQTQPTQIIFQSAPTSSIKPMEAQDPALTTNTFEGQKIKFLTATNQANQATTPQPGTTFQLGNQFFTITTAGKPPIQNQLNTDGSSTQTVYQVVHLQPTATNTLNNIEIINNNAKLIKLPDAQVKETSATTLDKTKTKSHKCSFQQQLSADMSTASKPDTKTSFKNYNDACKRLLRYHVFYQEDMKKEKLDKFDQDFEVLSQYLLYKKEQLHRRFQFNILKLAMKTHSPAENIMLDKMFVEEEKDCLKEDKELVAKGNRLDLPEPPFEWREKINNLVEEELTKYNEEQQSKKRKLGEGESDAEQGDLKIKKSDLANDLVNESDDEEEDSEASGAESNDLHEFNKYLDNLNDDINQIPIEGLSPLYNNSNSYNSMMQITDHQTSTTSQSDTNLQTSHHSNTFNLFNSDWQTATTDANSSVDANQQNKTSSTSWVQEDAVAVESILDGEVDQSGSNYIDSNLNHPIPNLQSNLDEFDDGEDDDNQLNFNQMNASGNNLMFDHHQKSNNSGSSSHLNLNSDSDIQMESAINSILDILVPPTDSNVSTNENGISSTHSNSLVGDDQLSANGFNVNFDTNLTSSSQVNFSQNNYLTSMPSIGMQTRPNTFGTDHYNDQIDEAVKSILS